MATTSTLWYLKNLPLYRDVKPYVVNIPLSHIPSGQRTNQECYPQSNIKFNNIRLSKSTFNLDAHGFEVSTQIPLFLNYEEFNEADKVRDIYCRGTPSSLKLSRKAKR
ncbi:hypothetical protein J7337_011089 [Fusarium musae]|uniref:Uncharacterized protein n=1 Tax=Fusarium musae TaxID=1042133 RepID=A0A9P8DA95_9HYPO|nr:hypothetical protein J7337_011089 [Fusarium musae]KAG9498194.1 hypothetical protein J7337_011089 [Fusarium musae]